MKKIISFLIIVVLLFQLSGCAYMAKTEVRQAVGGLTGMLIGGLISGNLYGVVLGGMFGIAFGPVIGDIYDKKIGTRKEAALKHNYNGDIEKIYVGHSYIILDKRENPLITGHVQYSVLAPDETKKLMVKETRFLINDKKGMIKLSENMFLRSQGIYDTALTFMLPKEISNDDSILITVISNEHQSESILLPLNAT